MKQFSLKSKEELQKEENSFIEPSLGDPKCLNCIRATFNREAHLEILKKSNKKYRERFPDKVKECRLLYNKTHEKEIVAFSKQYYEKNRDIILSKCRQKVQCECGSIVSRSGLSIHKRRKKHIEYMKTKQIKTSQLLN